MTQYTVGSSGPKQPHKYLREITYKSAREDWLTTKLKIVGWWLLIIALFGFLVLFFSQVEHWVSKSLRGIENPRTTGVTRGPNWEARMPRSDTQKLNTSRKG